MKSEFEGRPIYARRESRIKAYFLTCHISLLVYRLLEKNRKTTIPMSRFAKPYAVYRNASYKRTDITDDLHNAFDFLPTINLYQKLPCGA